MLAARVKYLYRLFKDVERDKGNIGHFCFRTLMWSLSVNTVRLHVLGS